MKISDSDSDSDILFNFTSLHNTPRRGNKKEK